MIVLRRLMSYTPTRNNADDAVLRHLYTAPETYGQMLWKIAVATGLSTFGCLWVASKVDAAVDSLLFGESAAHVEVLGISVPILPVVVAVVVSLVSRAVRLHDRVSDILGIRRRFDIREIIKPMAAECGVTWNSTRDKRAVAQRDRVMRRTFYRYASSTNPVIDRHLIIAALDKWSWFWIIVETEVLLAMVGAILLGRGHSGIALMVAAVMAALGILARMIELGCRSNAEAQVDEILSDATRRAEVCTELNALLG